MHMQYLHIFPLKSTVMLILSTGKTRKTARESHQKDEILIFYTQMFRITVLSQEKSKTTIDEV